jgi:uncharacterized protein (TIGR03437 family)
MSLTTAILRAAVAVLIGTVLCYGQTSDPVSTVPSAALVPAPGSPYVIPQGAAGIATADFNGDGLADVIVSETNGFNPGTLTVFLATGGGQFVAAPDGPLPVGFDHESLAIADFNGDGKLDIASLGPRDLAVFFGDGKGGFSLDPATPLDIPAFGVAAVENSMAVGDFNGDGRPDLVTVSVEEAGDVLVLLGDGTGNFAPAPGSPMHTGLAAQHVVVADFNMDGHLDLATAVSGNQVDVLLGDGTGRFAPDPKGPFPVAGQGAVYLTSGDFNRDGFLDLAITTVFAPNLTILLGDGDGGFRAEPAVNWGFNMLSIAASDIDGDGNLDLAITTESDYANGLLILLGDGKGGFQLSASGVVSFLIPGPVTLADFNGDGRVDAAVVSGDGPLSVALGAATAASSLTLTASANPTVGAPLSITVDAATSGFRAPTGQVTVSDGTTVIGTVALVDESPIFQVTPATTGTHSYVAVYPGNTSTTGSTSPALTVDVAKGSQSITFPAVANHTYGDAPFSVSASSSAGLPVTITVVSGPATIAGSTLSLTGPGTVTLLASQPGNANYLAATSIQQHFQVAPSPLRIAAVVNAASYKTEALAPDSYGVMFGADLASMAMGATLASSLGGTTIQISDSSGKTSDAELYFASPTQINFLLPSNLTTGKATLKVQAETGPSTTIGISIAAVSPGLFSADASGTGVAAGGAVRVSADGTQTQLPISSCSGTPVTCVAVPIDLGTASDTVYLSLYGTGIRGRSARSSVSATIGGTPVNVQYAGAQPNFPGLDQVNLIISPTLRGSGVVPIVLSVDGIAANTVTVAIQ